MATCGNDRLLFLHIAKTGGTWVSKTLAAAGVVLEPEGGEKHANLSHVAARGRFRFGFVRDPFEWYGSYWQYAQKVQPTHRMWAYLTGWQTDRFINLSFPKYLEATMGWTPGWLTDHYTHYVGTPQNEIEFVGRYETLVDDLVRALRLAGQDFDEAALRAVAPVNTSGEPPPCPLEIRERLKESERGTYERFYGLNADENAH